MNKYFVSWLVMAFAFCGSLSVGAQTQVQNPFSQYGRLVASEAHVPIHVTPAADSGPTGYTPQQIRRAYGFDRIFNYSQKPYPGMGQSIAIVVAYGSPTVQRDLGIFCRRFGVSANKVYIYYPLGRPKRTDPGWALETSLDVQWAHAIAPGARIHLVVSRSASIGDML